MSEEQNPNGTSTTRFDVLIVVAVTLVVVIALVATLLRVGGGSSDEQTIPTTAVDSAQEPGVTVPDVVEPAVPTYPVADEVDQEVENWHNGALPYLFRLTSTLGTPISDDMTVVRVRCVNVGLLSDDLRAYERAPREDLAAAIDVWLGALDSAVDYCTSDATEDPEEIRSHNIFLAFEESARLWGDVMASLASYGISLER